MSDEIEDLSKRLVKAIVDDDEEAALRVIVDNENGLVAANTVRGIERWTPMHFAAYHGRSALLRVLLDNGVAGDVRDALGAMPAEYAAYGTHACSAGAECEHDAVIERLLARSHSDPETQQQFVQNLHNKAAEASHATVLKYFAARQRRIETNEDPDDT